ncbi:MAG: hypothetical protein EOO38_24960 [Cytophagaceae bacterium]|nr:MAG: hypothetical protein EOO38_24960 [Cytophagaceae bacterium]
MQTTSPRASIKRRALSGHFPRVSTIIRQFANQSGFDNFCPVGPCVVSTRAMANPHKLNLQTTVDGRVLQDGTSATMVFTIAE